MHGAATVNPTPMLPELGDNPVERVIGHWCLRWPSTLALCAKTVGVQGSNQGSDLVLRLPGNARGVDGGHFPGGPTDGAPAKTHRPRQ